MSGALKLPVPEPALEVPMQFSNVGLGITCQTMPRSVTDAPPSVVMLPPLTAEKEVTSLAEKVVNSAKAVEVLKLTSLPYAVPTLLDA